MSRTKGEGNRDAWWELKLARANTPKEKVKVLQDKLLADIAKLPQEQQDQARELLASMLEQALDEITIHLLEERWSA